MIHTMSYFKTLMSLFSSVFCSENRRRMAKTINLFKRDSSDQSVEKDNAPSVDSKRILKIDVGVEETKLWLAFITYLGYGVLVLAGLIRDAIQYLCGNVNQKPRNQNGFKSLMPIYENFFTRNIFSCARHLFGRPLKSIPAVTMDVYNLGRHEKCNMVTLSSENRVARGVINIGSYNYLGFAERNSFSEPHVIECVRKNGVATCCPNGQIGQFRIQREMEKMMAKFLKKEDCVAFGMGFATNSTNIGSLVSKQCLILSDQYNHSSIVLGSRMSGATIKIFPHNDIIALEQILRDSIVYGQPRTRRPWRKILIIVEGVYSMEGTICNLPELIRLKKKYKAYLYLDEAHSIGAVGPNGGGVADLLGCDTADIDIMMGTFTKSFASSGGYIASSKAVIDHIRNTSHAVLYASAMSPPICEQIACSLKVMTGIERPGDGQRRFKALAENTAYFRRRLKELGYVVYGHDASPVVPLLVFMPGKIRYLGEELLNRGIALVVVGFPATNLVSARIRFCLSAGHTKEQLDYIISSLEEVETYAKLQYSRRSMKK
ncbi:hypothetical protein ACOME3_003510 [Neoechinorhynchus agilis]